MLRRTVGLMMGLGLTLALVVPAQAAFMPGDDYDVSPVPEPASLSLLALGGVVMLRRRNHRLKYQQMAKQHLGLGDYQQFLRYRAEPKLMKVALTALVLLSLPAVAGAQLPLAGTLDGLGVQTGMPLNRDKFRAAGLKFARVGMPWGFSEQSYGVHNFNPASDYSLDAMINGYAADGARVMLTLAGSGGGWNPLPNYGTPNTEAFRQGFANWCAAAAARYKGKGVVYELWNEPNDGSGNPYYDLSASDYMALIKVAVPAIRSADPNATIIGPASCPSPTGIDTTYISTCVQQGLLDLVDAVSVHPYQFTNGGDYQNNPTNPERVVSQYTALKNVIGTKPIVSSEWGYNTVMPGITAQVQGNYLARSFLVNISQGVVMSTWFKWTRGSDPTSAFDMFGIVNADGTPTPAYQELQLLTTSLEGTTFSGRLTSTSSIFTRDRDWLLEFAWPDSDEKTLAYWTTGNARTVIMPGWGTLNLTNTPQYINPVPEPGTLALLAMGMIGVLGCGRRGKSRCKVV